MQRPVSTAKTTVLPVYDHWVAPVARTRTGEAVGQINGVTLDFSQPGNLIDNAFL